MTCTEREGVELLEGPYALEEQVEVMALLVLPWPRCEVVRDPSLIRLGWRPVLGPISDEMREPLSRVRRAADESLI